MAQAPADLHLDDRVTVHFVEATDPETGTGWFTDRDVGDEIRSWGCAEVVAGRQRLSMGVGGRLGNQ